MVFDFAMLLFVLKVVWIMVLIGIGCFLLVIICTAILAVLAGIEFKDKG